MRSCGKSGAHHLYDADENFIRESLEYDGICGGPDYNWPDPHRDPVPSGCVWYCENCLKHEGKIW